jgi:hypothetical protein
MSAEDFTPEDLHWIIQAHCPHTPKCAKPCNECEDSYEAAMYEMAN